MATKSVTFDDGIPAKTRVDEDGRTRKDTISSENWVWDTVGLAWVRMTQPGGGGGGGGAVTVADGADVAQGTTTDLSTANTVVGLLKNIKAALAGTLQADVTDRAGRLLGIVSGPLTDAQLRASAVPVDTELPAAVLLADAAANPTPPAVGAFNMVWNGATWDRLPGSAAAGAKVQSAQLPTLLVGGRLSVDASGVAVPVTDNAGSLTVDAPVGTPVFSRLSDGAAALVGQKTMALSLPVAIASDQSVLPAVAEQRGATLHVTGTAAVNTAVTVTLPAPGAGLFHYITSIQVTKLYSVVGVAAGAGVIITSTNLPGNPAWTTEQLASVAGTATKVLDYQPTTPLKSSVANTATTIVAPLQLQTIWRINVSYFTAA